MKFALRLLVVQVLLVTSAWAAGFTVHYVARARQLWFIQPLAEKGDYRICVTIFGSDGAPQREVTALKATYADGFWYLRNGWEIILDRDTFELQEVNQLNGAQPEFTLDPSTPPAADPRIVTMGRGTLFSERATPPNYMNFSLFTADAQSGNVTYLFARRATLLVANGQTSGALSKVLTVTFRADTNAPMTGTVEESQF